jgi:hypothetical protein
LATSSALEEIVSGVMATGDDTQPVKSEAQDGVAAAEKADKLASAMSVLTAVSEEIESHPVTPVVPEMDRDS